MRSRGRTHERCDARNAIWSLCYHHHHFAWSCVLHCTMRLFPVFLNLSYYLLWSMSTVAVLTTASLASVFLILAFTDFTIRLWVPTNQVHGDGKAHENTVSLQLKMPNILFSFPSLPHALRFSLSQRISNRVDIFHLLSTSSAQFLVSAVERTLALATNATDTAGIKYVEKNLYQL